LDAKLRLEMRSELKRIQNELGITTVYVTHNQEEAMSMGDKIVVLNDGTIRQVADPEELYERPRTTWVAKFIGSPPMNLFEGENRDGTVRLAEGNSLPMPAETSSQTVSVGVRPEDIDVSTEAPDTDWTVPGTVKTVEPLGEYVLVNVEVGGSVVNVKVPKTEAEAGDPVHLTFDPT
ncbi:ABC transporter ATP-binding protein, partial [Halorubrum ezzemoulense]